MGYDSKDDGADVCVPGATGTVSSDVTHQPDTAGTNGEGGRADHLRQHRFKPGQSGNPSGRPRKHPITEPLIELCQGPLPDDVARAGGLEPGSNWAMLLAKNLLRKAAKGDMQALREILDRVEGRARMPVEHSVDESVQQAMSPLKTMTQQDLRQGMLNMLEELGHSRDRAEALLRGILCEDSPVPAEQ